MNEGLLSKRYAKALLEYAVEKGEENTFYDRMLVLSDRLASTPQIKSVLLNPIISHEEKSSLIINAAGKDVEDGFKRFVELVVSNRRESVIREIALSYIDLFRRRKNITVVTITTVNNLSEELLERIKVNLEERTKSSVEIINNTDPSIEGGFKFKVDDMLLDASIAGQLEKIRKQLLVRNRKIV